MATEDMIRNRITQLRMKKGVSEYQMSLDLGHSKSYMQSISSGRALPSMSEFLVICDYLGVTPHDFFDEGAANPALITEILQAVGDFSDEDLKLLLAVIQRMKQ